MKSVLVVAVALAVCSVQASSPDMNKCVNWVVANHDNMALMSAQNNFDSCSQFCMAAGTGFQPQMSACSSLCESSGSVKKFSKALAADGASPVEMCESMFAVSAPVSMLEVASTQAVKERKMGVRGDMTVQGTLSTSMLTSPIGDVKVSGELNVMNQIESNSARAANLKSDGSVSIKNGIKSKKDQLLIKGKIDADSVSMDSLQASSFLEINGVKQWALHSLEDFEEVGVDGWNVPDVTDCAGHKLLGGHCVENASTLKKEFTGLPEHTQLRINAKYMFIDSWDGESGYLKVNGNIVWTQSYNHAVGEAKHGINMCGNETPERQFGTPIDVTIPHKGDSVVIEFGATTDEHPCDESFGVDSVMLFTR